jgi:hypothetical protein
VVIEMSDITKEYYFSREIERVRQHCGRYDWTYSLRCDAQLPGCADLFSTGLCGEATENPHEICMAAHASGWVLRGTATYCPTCWGKRLTRVEHHINKWLTGWGYKGELPR